MKELTRNFENIYETFRGISSKSTKNFGEMLEVILRKLLLHNRNLETRTKRQKEKKNMGPGRNGIRRETRIGRKT